MRGIISPYVIAALIILTLAVYVEYNNYKIIEDDIQKETEIDIHNHKKVLNEIAKVAKIKTMIYKCAERYNCTNKTTLVNLIHNCTNYNVLYNGSFFVKYNHTTLKLNSKYLGCKNG